jgi:DNA processing protein
VSLLTEKISDLELMKSYPKSLSFAGNKALLQKEKISIIGSRKPSKYAREISHQLSCALSKAGICIVSGGAMGIDAIAHMGAGSNNTISVLPCGINIKYPAINKNLLADIEKNGLLLSQFDDDFKAQPWSFVVRNELVVALGKVLVVSEAELGSGSMRSIEFALKMGKKIYVLPHRIGESSATQKLLQEKKAELIYDIDSFVSMFAPTQTSQIKKDEFQIFCETNPNYDEVVAKFPSRVFEAELNGEITVRNAKVYLV